LSASTFFVFTDRYTALTAIIVKFRMDVPNTAQNEHVCAQEVTFPKYLWACCAREGV